MIKVEKYKAFHGTMRITPKSKAVAPIEITGDWLYKPDTCCWYGNGASYGEDICTVVRDDSERHIPKPIEEQTEDDREFIDYVCPNCKTTLQQKMKQAKRTTIYKYKCCPDCGQKLDWGDEHE